MKAIIYCRQSFGQEQDSTSIEVQRDACRQWAQSHNVTVIAEFADANCSSELYPLCPEGIEAARIDRGFQEWLKAQRTQGRKQYKQGLGEAFQRIAAGGITHLIVYTRNRLGRTADNSYLDRFLTSYLMEHHVSLVVAQDGKVVDFSDDLLRLLMQMKDALDYKGLKEKRLASIESVSKRINSYVKWSNAFGVKMIDGKVTFMADHAKAVRYIFEQVVAGASYASILKALNGPEYRGLWHGKQCYPTNVSSILKNPTYCGYMTNREGVLGRATNVPEPVIPYSLWREAQEVVAGKKASYGKYNLAGQKQRNWLPLSGYLKCSCGRRMTMRVDRGRIAYCCDSPDHTRRIEVDESVLKTIQCTFIMGALESRRRLSSLSKASERADEAKARLERLEASLRAKMALVETEEDVALYAPILKDTKARIAEARQELLEAQAVGSGEEKRLAEQCEEDFHRLMEQEILPEQDYQRLLQQTVDSLVVTDQAVEVRLASGGAFQIPRIEGKWHARRLMRCTITADTADGTLEGLCHYTLHLFDGDEPVIAGGMEVYADEQLAVVIH